MEGEQFTVKIADQTWKNYDIDWSKVTTLDDVINLLRGMRITISLDTKNPNPDFAPLMPYLKESPGVSR